MTTKPKPISHISGHSEQREESQRRSFASAQDDIHTITTWLRVSTQRLKAVGIDSAQLDAQLLLAYAFGTTREWLAAHGDEELSADQLEKADQLCTQRVNHEPLAYITGSKEFYGRTFYVNKNVLIPRPESESIIDLLKEILKQVQDDQTAVVDVGTGSGCLAITAKLEVPEARVIGTDISEKAFVVARKNAVDLGADIEFIKSDLLQNIPSSIFHLPYTILANLPYVPHDMITSPEITKEPELALFSGTDGLDHYRRFWAQVASCKVKPYAIITESLESQHQAMREFAIASGYSEKTISGLAQLFMS